MSATPRPHFEEIDWFDYVRGEAEPPISAALGTHLKVCESCRSSLRSYERFARAVPAAMHLVERVDAEGEARDSAIVEAARAATARVARGRDGRSLLREAFALPRAAFAWTTELVEEAQLLSRELLRTDVPLAGRIVRSALAHLDSSPDPASAYAATPLRATLAYVLVTEGRIDEALSLLDRVRPDRQNSSLPEIERAYWHYVRAAAFRNVGRHEDALPEIRAAAALYTLLEDPDRVVRCQLVEAVLLTELGRPEEALVIDRALLDDAGMRKDESLYGTFLVNYGSDLLRVGRFAESRSIFARAIEVVRKTGQEHLLFRVRSGLAQIAVKEGRLEEALALNIALRPEYRGLSVVWEQILHELDIAELLLRLRRPDEAADVCRGLVPRAKETGLAREAARALAYLSEAERELDLARLGQVRQFLRRIERGENPVWSAA